MNKEELHAEKKTYLQPKMTVVEMQSSDIICTSTEGYDLNPNKLDDGDFE